MVREKTVHSVWDDLKHHGVAKITYFGSDVQARYRVDSAKLSLTTIVYRGGPFVPPSVRACIHENPPMPPTDIRTSLHFDEKSGQIHLKYLGSFEHFDSHYFTHVLEQFCVVADGWRSFINEHDERDLIRVKR